MFCRSLFVLLYFLFWPLCCLFFFDIRILIAPLVSSSSSYSYVCFVDHCLFFCTFYFGHCVVCSSSIYDSDCPFGIFKLFLLLCMFCRSLFVLLYFFFWPLCCLFFFDIRILIAPLVSSSSSYSYVCFVDRCLSFCTFSFGHCVVCSSSIYGF